MFEFKPVSPQVVGRRWAHLTKNVDYEPEEIMVLDHIRQLTECLFNGEIGFEVFSATIKQELIKVGW